MTADARSRLAGLLSAAAPLVAAAALAGAPMVSGVATGSPVRAHAAITAFDQCNSPAGVVRPMKWPLCAGD